ncbi:hypothetical protein RDWZM_003787 [Blomia tropicalis]|uniref:HMG box domain-containing protein n=1 Tax=Blomia tropicalis TaxID=40697 RepID=A0A9Q0MIX8_BLOTA|nr:hypothetical protein RDWZM_003787 [Blomia tropicalis]
MALSRDFMTSETSVYSSTTSVKSSLPVPPKRSPNVFALFVKNSFKDMPADLPVKQKFIRAAEEWRELSENQKEEYKKQMTEGLVQYKKQMADYLDSLSPQELDDFKKQRKEKIKDKTRQRIKGQLRKLNYPKRPLSSYIFFLREKLHQEYPDGKYPPVKTPEHIRFIGIWSQRWRAMNIDERKPFAALAEKDRLRYFEELEKWKQDLAKPENEENLVILERLSKRIGTINKVDDEMKKKKKKASKVVGTRKLAKAKKSTKAKSKKTTKTKTTTAKSN